MALKQTIIVLFDSKFPVHKIEFTTVPKSKSKGMNLITDFFYGFCTQISSENGWH